MKSKSRMKSKSKKAVKEEITLETKSPWRSARFLPRKKVLIITAKKEGWSSGVVVAVDPCETREQAKILALRY